MNKKFIGFFVFLILLFGIFLVNSSLNEKEKVSPEVYMELEKNNTVIVIIDINSNEEKSLFKTTTLEDRKEKVKKEINNKDIGESKDLISAEITGKELNELEKDKGIESIRPIIKLKAFLQDSVPLINTSLVWSINLTQNITGINETICVIDSGINFSHENLVGKNKTCVIDCYNKECIEDCSIGDDNGHGTHVAGIIASSGSLNGVAIGANLIGLKVLDSNGDGHATNSEFDLENAIDWCVSNKNTYNISVISMSLGGGQYNYFCDSVTTTTWTRAINNATTNNISVIVATGNTDGSYPNATAGIAIPACITNSIRVTATDKSDNYASYAFRNKNFTDILVAPGTSINSTMVSSPGGDILVACGTENPYCSLSGTSMATPHVAGAFALFRHFFRMQNNKEPLVSEIKTSINSTGKQIPDSQTGLTLSRIDIYSAIKSVDISNPVVNLLSPTNNTVQFTQNISFSCSVNDVQLHNLTLYVWNSSGIYNNTESVDLSEVNGNLEKNISNFPYGDYTWNCLAYDQNLNFSFANYNSTLIIGQTVTTLNSPSDNSFVNQNQTYNCSAGTEPTKQLTNLSFYIWNSTNDLIYNATENVNGTTNSSLFYFNFTSEEEHTWNCLTYNNESESDWQDNNFTITYDISTTNISFISNSSITSSGATITWKTNESSNSSVNYGTTESLGSTTSNSSYSVNHSISLSGLGASTVYYYNIISCDRANNCNTSGIYNFLTPAATPAVNDNSGGGGGGGSSISTYVPTLNQSSSGYTQSLKVNDKIKFTFFDKVDEPHFLIVNTLTLNSASITIQSDPIKLTLGIGQSAKLNLTDPNYYDFYVRLNKIESSKADITIQTINEEIPKSAPITGEVINDEVVDSNEEEIDNELRSLNLKIVKLKVFVYIIVIIFIIAVIFLLFKEKKHIKKAIKDKKKQHHIQEHRKKFEEIKPKKSK